MAVLPIIPDTYRVAFNWKDAGGQTAANVMHFLDSASTAAGVGTKIDANVTVNMWASTVVTAGVQTLVITKLDGSSSTFIKPVSGSKWNGPGSGEFIPQMAQVVSIRTAFRGRSKRGRVFLPFTAEAGQGNGQLLSANVVAGNAAWAAFLAAMIAAGCQPVVASYKLATQVPVTSYIYEGATGTQRRRQSRNR